MHARAKVHAVYYRLLALLVTVLCLTCVWMPGYAVAEEGASPSLDEIAKYLRDSLADIDRDDAVYYNDDGKILVVEVGNHQGSYAIIRIHVADIKPVKVSGKEVIVSRTPVREESELRIFPVIDITVYDGNRYGDAKYPMSVTLRGKSPQAAKRIAGAIQYLMKRMGNPYLDQERENKEQMDKALGVE